MRLLSKSDIDKAKAQVRKSEIDEGLKLSRRVDNLRELVGEEEASLEKFRRESIARINEEITKATTSRDKLTREVKELEDRKIEALKPLDAEWSKVGRIREELEEQREAFALANQIIETEKGNLKNERKEVEQIHLKTRQSFTATNELLEEAIADREEAKTERDNAVRIKENTEQERLAILDALVKRDAELAVRERELELREDKLAESEKKLANEWVLLEDRKQMFIRDKNRKS